MLDNANNKDLVDKRIMYNKKSLIACSIPITSVRVKGAMSLRNGMWHGLRNDTTMRNLIYGKWRKEKIQQESMHASLPRLFWCQFEGAIDLLVHLLLLLKQG